MDDWTDVKSCLPPDTLEECLVTDGYGGYAVAYYHYGNNQWYASEDMLDASNHDGGAMISLSEDVTHWQLIRGI